MKVFFFVLILSLALLSFPIGAETLSTGGPYTVGETITIQGETNFNTDNKVLVEIYPSSFGPTSKYEPSMTGGGSMVIPVVMNGSGLFSWTANISSAGWKPEQYMVRVEVIGKDYRETALVSLTENQSPEQTLSSPFQGKPNSSSSEPDPLQTVEPVLTQKKDLTEPTIPVPAQTRQSPVSVGFIVCSLALVGIFAGKRRG
ncbi:MAG: hypothetical protein CVV33_01970 [Methanomicrobiales archaeon HGW-Methanomicrobiales-4]|nr:MAG: hypothetical protein CVV33_01970 [Methanomicrobiales archaeon HGW-Methanomicrobiales-4]